jgi:hypothetical protein
MAADFRRLAANQSWKADLGHDSKKAAHEIDSSNKYDARVAGWLSFNDFEGEST